MNEYTASALHDSFFFCQLACNYYSICAQKDFFTRKNLFESSSVVLALYRAYLATSMNESESNASYVLRWMTRRRPSSNESCIRITWLRSNITYIIQYSWLVRVEFDVISVYSLNPGKLPGRFSYERLGYEVGQNPCRDSYCQQCTNIQCTRKRYGTRRYHGINNLELPECREIFEWALVRGYSEDLHWRALWQRHLQNKSVKAIFRGLYISQ